MAALWFADRGSRYLQRVASPFSRPAIDGLLYVANRHFEVGQPVCALQRSAAAVGWAVHDGQKRVVVNGRFPDAQNQVVAQRADHRARAAYCGLSALGRVIARLTAGHVPPISGVERRVFEYEAGCSNPF